MSDERNLWNILTDIRSSLCALKLEIQKIIIYKWHTSVLYVHEISCLKLYKKMASFLLNWTLNSGSSGSGTGFKKIPHTVPLIQQLQILLWGIADRELSILNNCRVNYCLQVYDRFKCHNCGGHIFFYPPFICWRPLNCVSDGLWGCSVAIVRTSVLTGISPISQRKLMDR